MSLSHRAIATLAVLLSLAGSAYAEASSTKVSGDYVAPSSSRRNPDLDPLDRDRLSGDSLPEIRSAMQSAFQDKDGDSTEDTCASQRTAVDNGRPSDSPQLQQNYPNPFNQATEIAFTLPRSSRAKLEVFNVVGQRIVLLIDEELSSGRHEASWDGLDVTGKGVASGIYFYRLEVGEVVAVRKMILMK